MLKILTFLTALPNNLDNLLTFLEREAPTISFKSAHIDSQGVFPSCRGVFFHHICDLVWGD